MNIWIVTIGNSDIKLGNIDQWNEYLLGSGIDSETDILFEPKKLEGEDLFTVPARVMGIVIGNQLNDENYQGLHFPMLKIFSEKLQDEKLPHRIIVILTDQKFAYKGYNINERSPYWKDTCTLKPILDKYLKSKFPDVRELEYVELQPESKTQSLDNWDQSLSLVQTKLSELEFNSLDDIDNVYVSHQAGIPAISSAIQFVTLAKFGKKVKFLVSNEYEPENTRFISSSNYLRGIQLQEAKRLLQRFDYSGVLSLLDNLDNSTNKEDEVNKLREMLGIAIEWNLSNFKNFSGKLKKLPKFEKKVEESLKCPCWTGYEAAYLAVVRVKQNNNVEALFHSFRSVEGSMLSWFEHKYKEHVNKMNVKKTIMEELPPEISEDLRKNLFTDKEGCVKSKIEMRNIIKWFEIIRRPEWEKNDDISQFIKSTKKIRNAQFHTLLGLEQKELFKAWETDNEDDWQNRVLGCLNFVATRSFKSLEDASLMPQVHRELTIALDNYESKCLYS
ncbi:MAG: hypothetical protein ACL9RN_11210 [Cylindrospermopsis raciborskii]|jgi:hypothetical protein|uniref:hypothetical protein n=1 Tax=Cylindrospermopsis raciborskii TaxID=77022 RepID=UPI003D0A011F